LASLTAPPKPSPPELSSPEPTLLKPAPPKPAPPKPAPPKPALRKPALRKPTLPAARKPSPRKPSFAKPSPDAPAPSSPSTCLPPSQPIVSQKLPQIPQAQSNPSPCKPPESANPESSPAAPDIPPQAPAPTFDPRPSSIDPPAPSPATSDEPPIDNGYIAPVFTSRPDSTPARTMPHANAAHPSADMLGRMLKTAQCPHLKSALRPKKPVILSAAPWRKGGGKARSRKTSYFCSRSPSPPRFHAPSSCHPSSFDPRPSTSPLPFHHVFRPRCEECSRFSTSTLKSSLPAQILTSP
jgi:hypothetical protein